MEDLEDGSIEKDRRAYGGGPRLIDILKADHKFKNNMDEHANKFLLKHFQDGKSCESPEEREDGS